MTTSDGLDSSARPGVAASFRRPGLSLRRFGMAGLLLWLAVQNLGRKRARTLSLMAAVGIATAVLFAGSTLMRSIETSMDLGFTRLGADVMIVSNDTLANITASLLTVEPTPHTLKRALLDETVLDGIARVAPQRTFRTTEARFGPPGEIVDIIGFDPDRDFTVLPWLEERLAGPMQFGDVIVGARRDFPVGSRVPLFDQEFRVYGRLGRSGVGTHEGAFFVTFETIDLMSLAIERCEVEVPQSFDPDYVSGFLVELSPGADALRAQFALLSAHPEVKVVTGEGTMTAIRQGLSLLLGGTLGLIIAMFLALSVLVCVLFSAIVGERRRELGLLKAIGLRRRQVETLVVLEAGIATGAGAILGIVIGGAMLRLTERLLVDRLETVGIPFVWLGPGPIALAAALCVLAAIVVGCLGAIIPARRASRRDSHDLIQAADGS